MTTENRRFLASDLSQELELPRSTINDWLTRYAEYLESENRGKRRFYSEKSLNILREIAELRNAGKSSFEIEQQLAARYGIRPEVAHPEEPETAVAEAPTAPRDPEENSASAPRRRGKPLPMLRPAFDEMSSQFTREFTALAAKFEELERERRRMFRRMWFAGLAIMAAALLLLLLLGAALWTLHGKFERSKAESTAAMATLTRDGEKLSGQLESIRAEQRRETEKLGVMLDRSRADFQRNAERLGSELAEQRKGFEHRIAELSADAEKSSRRKPSGSRRSSPGNSSRSCANRPLPTRRNSGKRRPVSPRRKGTPTAPVRRATNFAIGWSSWKNPGPPK
ncbi:MAG: helix-turn-helix domain-containing protein [Lentisphaeria bacterium]|nr:MAG: helix-turn-helix domain-containing protein [Lentisphaeria bacterium]